MSNQCEKCERTVKLGHKWDAIRAHRDGWYFFKNGTILCPDHRPPWAPRKP